MVKQFLVENTNYQNMDHGFNNQTWRNPLAPFQDALAVYRNERHPQHVQPVHVRNFMRSFGAWPSKSAQESPIYRFITIFLIITGLVFCFSITLDLYESSQDILLFGDDLVVLIGLYLIWFKMLLHYHRADEMQDIIMEFNKMHFYFAMRRTKNRRKVRQMQRLFFLAEVSALGLYFSMAILLACAICIPPWFHNEEPMTPYRAVFPFLKWKNYSETPKTFIAVYAFQSFSTLLSLFIILGIDNMICHLFTQTTLNFKLFLIWLQELGTEEQNDDPKVRLSELREIIVFHQYIISLINKINKCCYLNFVSQMGASTFMICLTAFMAMMAQDQPMVALKFQVYMFSVFQQLFYWCWTGNMAYYTSLDIADAAYLIHNWYDQSSEYKFYLSFMIMRAQKPLMFRPTPFYAFNFETFATILSTSYSYFALLRTMND